MKRRSFLGVLVGAQKTRIIKLTGSGSRVPWTDADIRDLFDKINAATRGPRRA